MAAKRPPQTPAERTAAARDPAPRTPASPPEDGGGDGVVPKLRRAVHDLRQPVQAMRLFVHLLGTRLERDEDRALVGKLDEALDNIETALRSLMSSLAPPPADPVPGEDTPLKS
jgi:hypothetical protein